MLYHNFLLYFIRVTIKKKIIKVSIRKRFRPMHGHQYSPTSSLEFYKILCYQRNLFISQLQASAFSLFCKQNGYVSLLIKNWMIGSIMFLFRDFLLSGDFNLFSLKFCFSENLVRNCQGQLINPKSNPKPTEKWGQRVLALKVKTTKWIEILEGRITMFFIL